MGRGKHHPMDSKARKAKYAARFGITEKNKVKHLAKMKQDNPNYPQNKSRTKKGVYDR